MNRPKPVHVRVALADQRRGRRAGLSTSGRRAERRQRARPGRAVRAETSLGRSASSAAARADASATSRHRAPPTTAVDPDEQAGPGEPVGVGQRPARTPRRAGSRATPARGRVVDVQERAGPLDHLDVQAAHGPQVEQRRRDVDGGRLVVVRDRPAQRREQVLLLGGAAVERGHLPGADEVGRPSATACARAQPTRPAMRRVRSPGGVEPRLAVLADGLEHPVARRPAVAARRG